ncbi:MAG: PspC domain-containing protein [Butyrivibrio sp.]|nr:PspC domain-containing protein [Butyrivibrio sp.]
MNKKLMRSSTDVKLGGVCGGIAEYFNWDPSLVRIATLVLGITTQIGIVAYIAAWAILPLKDDRYINQ